MTQTLALVLFLVAASSAFAQQRPLVTEDPETIGAGLVLLEGGVKIYERAGALLHSKTALIDGVWSTVGSTNLDWRSFLDNDEE